MNRSLVSLVSLLVFAGACAAPSDAAPEGDGLEDVASSASGLATYWWTQGSPTTWMIPAADGVCWLSAITGDFSGPEELRITVDPYWKLWRLDGDSQAQGVGGSAQCVRWTDLTPSTARYVLDPSRMSVEDAYTCTSDWLGRDTCSHEPDAARFVPSGLGTDSFCALTKIGGSFMGGGERIWLEPPFTNGHSSWQINAISSYGASLVIDAGDEGAAVCAQVGPIRGAADYTWSQGQDAVLMAPVTGNYCFLTSVSGKFKGAGESVKISVRFDAAGALHWALTGTSAQEGVSAGARCISTTNKPYISG